MPNAIPPTAGRFRQLLLPGLAAVRSLWLAFGLIQLLGLLLVIAYFYVPSIARACDQVGAVKARTGLLFAAIAMPIACGVVPELFKFIANVDRTITRQRLGLTLHNMVLFCVGGVVIDLFYNWIGYAFGPTSSPLTVVAKVLIDQLVYTTIVGVPLIAVSYTLRNANYRLSATLAQLDAGWYLREVVPVLVTCWAYWFPMTSLMYTLPSSLTFVYGMVASAASATLLTAVAGRSEPRLADAHV